MIVQGKALFNAEFLQIDGLAPKDLYQNIIVAAEVVASTIRMRYTADSQGRARTLAQEFSVLDKKDTEIVDWIWHYYMQPNLENLVEWLIDAWVSRPERQCLGTGTTGNIDDLADDYLRHLILEEEGQKQVQHEQEAADDWQSDNSELPESVSSVINGVFNAEHDKWFYVENPKAENWNVTALETADEDFEEGLDVFFRRNKVTTVVPTASVARAVRYFEEAQQGQGVQIPGVVINGVLWSKVKRGKARILCRLDERDQLYFHVYPRRAWTRDMFD
jgi:hypothetical protein